MTHYCGKALLGPDRPRLVGAFFKGRSGTAPCAGNRRGRYRLLKMPCPWLTAAALGSLDDGRPQGFMSGSRLGKRPSAADPRQPLSSLAPALPGADKIEQPWGDARRSRGCLASRAIASLSCARSRQCSGRKYRSSSAIPAFLISSVQNQTNHRCAVPIEIGRNNALWTDRPKLKGFAPLLPHSLLSGPPVRRWPRAICANREAGRLHRRYAARQICRNHQLL